MSSQRDKIQRNICFIAGPFLIVLGLVILGGGDERAGAAILVGLYAIVRGVFIHRRLARESAAMKGVLAGIHNATHKSVSEGVDSTLKRVRAESEQGK